MDQCPIQWESKTLIRLTRQKPEISAVSMGHQARKGFSQLAQVPTCVQDAMHLDYSFFFFFHVSTDGMQYLTRCCIKGLRKADRHNTLSVCEKDDLNRRNMSATERKICRHSERVCCVKQIQQRMCSLGKYRAM